MCSRIKSDQHACKCTLNMHTGIEAVSIYYMYSITCIMVTHKQTPIVITPMQGCLTIHNTTGAVVPTLACAFIVDLS